jgi:toxin ParE1/3/4
MTLRFTPRARDDLRQIMEYIAKENPTAADRVGRAIFDTAALIARRPYLGIRNAKDAKFRSRLVTRYPYRISLFRRGRRYLDRSHTALGTAPLG